MNRLTQLDPAIAVGKAKERFTGVQAKLGIGPNLVRVPGNSAATLEGCWNFSGSLAGGVLSASVREQIAPAFAEMNDRAYCRGARSCIGGLAGLSEREITDSRKVMATDERTEAILNLARNVVLDFPEVKPSRPEVPAEACITAGCGCA